MRGITMITLTRLGHRNEPFHLNIDMIVTVESTPDTVITLATGAKVVVAETPADVAAAVHEFRASVLADAFQRRGRPGGQASPPPLAGVHREGPHLSAVASPDGEDDPN
jgi:flagellar protein FlbD